MWSDNSVQETKIIPNKSFLEILNGYEDIDWNMFFKPK